MERFKARPDAPSWWFGAPLIGVAFGFVANRFFPEFVAWSATIIYQISGNGPAPAAVAPDVTRFLSPLVGMVLAVLVLASVRLAMHIVRSG